MRVRGRMQAMVRGKRGRKNANFLHKLNSEEFAQDTYEEVVRNHLERERETERQRERERECARDLPR
jgi:hypothetical protein